MNIAYKDFVLMVRHLRATKYQRSEEQRPGVMDEVLWVFCETVSRWMLQKRQPIVEGHEYNFVLEMAHFTLSLKFRESSDLIEEIFEIFGVDEKLTVTLTSDELKMFGATE